MSIEFDCPGCSCRLRVEAQHAGARARCPSCGTIYTVPGGAAPATEVPPKWLVRIETGADFGPVDRSELDEWVAEGRITADTLLRVEQEDHWRPAVDLYPQLKPQIAKGENPFIDRPEEGNPYQAPVTSSTAHRTIGSPHRGGMILALSVLGLACCQLLAPVAWIMGYGDLRQMDRGTMDPSGRGLTQVGMVLGIIGTAIIGLSILAHVVMAVVAVVG